MNQDEKKKDEGSREVQHTHAVAELKGDPPKIEKTEHHVISPPAATSGVKPS
jgi:hypothetical protein